MNPMDDPYDTLTSRIEHIALNLALVSISRSSFLDHIHAVVSQLLKPNAEFFSITLNDTDVLLILDEDAGREFRSKETLISDDQNDADVKFEFDPSCGGVKVSRVQWSALSLDVSRSPARLRKISDSMQSSSIPVIYQSAMNCDYLFVPTVHLQQTLSLLSEEVGLVLSEDERTNRQRHSISRAWEKSQSRKPKRRTRHDHTPSQCSSPSSSDISSSDPRGRSKLPSQAIQRAHPPQNLPPFRLLPHKMVFHGLNSVPHGDWLLKLVKMIGWPDSLIVPKPPKVSPPEQFGYGNRYPSSRFFQQSPPVSNNERPRRPGFVSRHSDDAHSFKKGHSSRPSDLDLNAQARPSRDVVNPRIAAQVPTQSRSRSTSYPDVLPDFYCATQQRGATKRPPLPSQSNALPVSPGSPGFTLSLPPPAEHPPASQDQEAAPKKEESPAPSQTQLHTQTLPFFSLTHRTRGPSDTEVSIMTRGSLLAQLFESSMLIGGSGDIAISDSEEEGLCDYKYSRGDRSALSSGLNGSVHKKTSSIDEEPHLAKRPSSPGIQSSSSHQSALSGLDEGFKCLQVDLGGAVSKDHAKLLSFVTETLDFHGVKHHFARTLGAINVIVPYSQARRACDILRAVPEK